MTQAFTSAESKGGKTHLWKNHPLTEYSEAPVEMNTAISTSWSQYSEATVEMNTAISTSWSQYSEATLGIQTE